MGKLFFDRVSAGSHRYYTDEGYLVVPGRVARVGVQQYLARELDLTDRDPMAVVNVYRPPEEVFAADSLKSYAEKDVTDDHPSDLVDASSYRSVSVGHVCDAGSQEGEWVVAPMIIKARDAIEKIEAGKAELSAGYTAEYVREPGTTADGRPYEFIQRNIRINHVAVVDTARAGRHARLFDNGVHPMKVTLDAAKGLHAEVADHATATLIQTTIDGLRDMSARLLKARDEAEAEKEKAEAAKDEAEEKAEELEKKSSDAAISARVKAVLGVWDSARKLCTDFDPAGETDPMKVKRAVLAKIKPSRDWAAKGDAYIDACFDMETERKEAEDEDEEEEKKSTDSLGKDFEKLNKGKATTDGTDAYQKFLKGESK